MTDEWTEPKLAPIPSGSRGSTVLIHDRLRASILRGDLPAGAELSQAQLATEFGVSRGPVREALRLLQREGLIEAEVNRRPRVTPLSAQEVEHIYALRVVNESLALDLSVPRFNESDIARMRQLLDAIELSAGQDFAAWERNHQQFHLLLVSYAPPRMVSSLEQWSEHTQRYRRVYVGDTAAWTLGAAEHGQLVEACSERDRMTAVTLLARHLSRAALILVSMIEPEYDPTLLRAAMRQVSETSSAPDRPIRRAR